MFGPSLRKLRILTLNAKAQMPVGNTEWKFKINPLNFEKRREVPKSTGNRLNHDVKYVTLTTLKRRKRSFWSNILQILLENSFKICINLDRNSTADPSLPPYGTRTQRKPSSETLCAQR